MDSQSRQDVQILISAIADLAAMKAELVVHGHKVPEGVDAHLLELSKRLQGMVPDETA